MFSFSLLVIILISPLPQGDTGHLSGSVVDANGAATLGPAALSLADVHDITGPHLRGLGIAVFVCLVHLIAYGVGSPLMGKLNDLLGAATNPGMMRYGFLLSPVSCALGSLFLWRGSRALEKTHEPV